MALFRSSSGSGGGTVSGKPTYPMITGNVSSSHDSVFTADHDNPCAYFVTNRNDYVNITVTRGGVAGTPVYATNTTSGTSGYSNFFDVKDGDVITAKSNTTNTFSYTFVY